MKQRFKKSKNPGRSSRLSSRVGTKGKLDKKPRHRQPHKKTVEGILRLNAAFVGFVSWPERDVDIEIPHAMLSTALHGDLVRVCVGPKINGYRYKGEITEIITRKKTVFVGELKRISGINFFNCDDHKMYKEIVIPNKNLGGSKPGHKVAVTISQWDKMTTDAIGRVIRVLGRPGEHNTEIAAILYNKNISTDFPKDVLREAREAKKFMTEREIGNRKDMRNVTTITIDPKDAKDFDDALSVSQLENEHYEIGIHIADVTHFVRPGTALEQEAAKRATSTYLVDRTIPMLPEVLSNDLCSLNPGEDKLAFTAIFEIDSKGHVLKEWFGKTVIRSNKRFTYEEAQKILDKKCGDLYAELKILNGLSKKLRDKKFEKGAIAFEDTEVQIELDDKMKPIKIEKKKRLDTHKLIEDFMLLANRRVAEFASRKGGRKKVNKKFIYRVHDMPDEDKVRHIAELLRGLGYKIKISKNPTSGDINKILSSVSGKSEAALINQATIQAMAKAVYTSENIGHFGLAFPYYTHFTSPIRRYPDMMVHRLLQKYLNGKIISSEEMEKYDDLAAYSSQMERIAEEAERDSVKFKQAEYMENKIGQRFSGVISSVTKWGIYVREEKTNSEGLVMIRDLGDDYYSYDETRLALIGKRSKKKFQLGDEVNIKVKGVDVRRKQIDYLLI